MIVLAVDPGLTGGCAVLTETGLRAVFELPTMDDRSVGPAAMIQRKIDGRALVTQLRLHCPAHEQVRAVLEKVSVMPTPKSGRPDMKDNTAQAQSSLIRSFTTVETVLECLGWAPAYANPQTWKRFYGLIDSSLTTAQRKAKALACARRLYPDCGELRLAKDHNKAEAILLAHWFLETKA